MTNSNFIILSNGKKIEIKEFYENIKEDKIVNSRETASIFNYYNRDDNTKLNSSEISSILNSIKQYAQKDGDNILSKEELKEFANDLSNSCDEQPNITSKKLLKFLTNLAKNLKEDSSTSILTKVENNVDDIFPELKFLNLSDNQNVDISKLKFDNISKYYPSDKYNIVYNSEHHYLFVIDAFGREYTKEECEALLKENPNGKIKECYTIEKQIINKTTGKIVLTYEKREGYFASEHITIYNNENDQKLNITYDRNTASINSEFRYVKIRDNQVIELENNGEYSKYTNGIITFKETSNKRIKYLNGNEYSVTTTDGKFISNDSVIELKEIINTGKIDYQKIQDIVDIAIKNDLIGETSEDYYQLTGRELIDDIQNSNLSEQQKNELIEKISYPFVKANGFDKNKKIDNSQISTKFYTGENYSIQYNGPIVTISNKDTNETTRLNLLYKFECFDLKTKTRLKESMKNIQKLPAEILETLTIEVKQAKGLSKSAAIINHAAAYYTADGDMNIYKFNNETVVHELMHGVDNVNREMISNNGPFNDAYNDAIEKLKAKGKKTFDPSRPLRENIGAMYLPHIFGINYGTANAQEAFAICMQIALGYDKSPFAIYIKRNMPELIPIAVEQYKQIKQMSIEDRKS